MFLKKKIDPRIRTLIENGVNQRQRTMFVIVGDYAREQVVNIHYILSKARVRTRPNVLWCYKNELGFSSNRQRRAEKIKKQIKNGVRDKEAEDPFELFLGSTDIRYTYYKETDRILGQTFGMCVLQDFQSLTPNILARTVETVEGGGVICLLLKSMDSLEQLYKMSMDVHSRYRTEAHTDVVGRFNERFMLSLATCKTCVVVDDELNILPISSHLRDIQKVNKDGSVQSLTGEVVDDGDDNALFEDDHVLTPKEVELKELKASLKETQPIGALLDLARTLDQGKSVLTFAEAISDKSLKATVALLAARGRGKSASLGISLACAVAYGYSNIFVTAPSPENLKTLFEMTIKGFSALGYKEHIDYEVVQSLNPKLNKAVVRLNIFRSHRQTIQYIPPTDHQRLTQAELLVIDEAAAIPLPQVQRLIGPYLVFIASTVNGYEGTGRALSLKLIKQLREQAAVAHHTAFSQKNKEAHKLASNAAAKNEVAADAGVAANLRGRTLREVTLAEPIRYAENDPIEAWLNNLLCLNCTSQVPKLSRNVAGGTGVPHPSKCQLFYVDRDTLFSFHKASELFLQRMMALYVSSHYKNSPNDLQLMSDAPAHHLFVLLGPVTQANALPDILCVIQVCLEGEITSTNYVRHSTQGINPSGDLIPWCVSQQFQNSEFASLSGARVVRVAVHPELQHMGYGSRALELLSDYYDGKFTSLDEMEDSEDEETPVKSSTPSSSTGNLLTEVLTPRKNLPPLLCQLSDRKPETLHWLGVSFGLTPELYRFWHRHQFFPVYVRQSVNDVTGEHTCVMVRAQHSAAAARVARSKGIAHAGMDGDTECKWLVSFNDDFRRRFISLLGFEFRSMPTYLALSVLQKEIATSEAAELRIVADSADADKEDNEETSVMLTDNKLTAAELAVYLSPYDLKRLESYALNMIDYHLILDLLPTLARLYFSGKTGLQLTTAQGAIFLALGLQFKPLFNLEFELGIGATQLLALFNKSIRKFAQYLRQVQENAYTAEIKAKTAAKTNQNAMALAVSTTDAVAVTTNLQTELKDSAALAKKAMKEKQKDLLASLSLEKYAISASDDDWAKNADKLAAAVTTGKSVAIKAGEEKAALQKALRDGGDPRDKKAAAVKRKAKEEDKFVKKVRSEMTKKYGK